MVINYKTEDDEKINVKISVNIPSNRFDEFFNFLLKNFNVRHSYVKNYKISIKQEINELDVIRQTLDNLDQIEREILNMAVNEQKINFLMIINNEKMDLVSKMRSFQSTIEEKMQRGECSTFLVNFTQTKPFKIITDDYKEAIKGKIKSVINNSIYFLLDFTDLIPFVINSLRILIKDIIVGVLIIIFVLIIGKFWLYVKRRLGETTN